jgi:hypothetical protein
LLPRNESRRYIFATGMTPGGKETDMHPVRAFVLSLTCGLAVLISVRVLISAMQPAPDQRVGSGPIEIPTA